MTSEAGSTLRGSIDVVRPDGLIEGWCWDEAFPGTRVGITVLVDGIEAGSCLAALYREDLRLAKMGDGYCAFSFVTPTVSSSDKRTQTYTLIETGSRRPVGSPLVVHNKNSISFDNRLIELETKNRLLTDRLEEFSQREARTSSAELFAVVGGFFTRMAKEIERGEPLSIDERLGEIVETATEAHRPLALPVPEYPTMTILVQASASLAQIHACLDSLANAGVGEIAGVVVIDDGRAQDAILTPGVVRGIRYIRTVTDLVSEWSEAERADNAEILLLLSGAALVGDAFLREIVDAFSHNDKAAAIGCHALGTSGAPSAGGFCLLGNTLHDCVKAGHPEPKADLTGAYPVHALSHRAVAFRRSALRAVGGLDATFGNDLGAAVIDACFRLRKRGWSVLVQPFVTLELQPALNDESWMTPCLAGASRAGDMLRVRWLDSPAASPPLFVGHAAIVGTPGSLDEELLAVRALREWGYSVEYLAPTPRRDAEVRELRRAGATVTTAEEVGDALRGCGATVIYAAADSAALDLIPEGSRVVIGHLAMTQALSSENDTEAHATTLADAPPSRQIKRS